MKTKLILVSTALLLQGCESTKETLGMTHHAPNEYAVQPSTVPLEMPPDYHKLPQPKPGTPRPQEPSANAQAQAILTGKTPTTTASSEGQDALLKTAGSDQASDDVRAEVDHEAEVESRKQRTIVEQLRLKKHEAGDPIKATEEQKRLKEAGVKTPELPQK